MRMACAPAATIRSPLERDGVVFLPLTWTVVHPIDESSPLHGETPESLRSRKAEILVLLRAFDENFPRSCKPAPPTRWTRSTWGARFANAFMANAAENSLPVADQDKKVAVDMRLFDKVEPAPALLNR